MKQLRWVGIALSVGLLTGCPGVANLNPNTINQINALLGEYGISLKTVDPSTGTAKTFAEADIDSVIGEDGKPIAYKFESGKMVFRPTKEGQQKITVKFKDGTTQQFTIEGKQGDTRTSGDVAFIPDSSGQGFTTEVGIGTEINVQERHQQLQNAMATKRIKLTFGGAAIDGLTPLTLKAVYFDRMKLPNFAYVVESGALKVDPNPFFMAREYQERNGSYPMIRVAYMEGTTLKVVIAKMTSLPQLPNFEPPKPGEVPPPPPAPDAFTSNQTLNLDSSLTESYAGKTLAQYETENQLLVNVPRPGEAPPPPSATEQAAIREKINQYAVTFDVPDLAGVASASVKAMFVGKMDRPLVPMAPDQPPVLIDLLSISSTGSIKLDPMMVHNIYGYWKGQLQGNTSNFPWVRIYYATNTGAKVVKFRFKPTGPSWFVTPANWTPPTKPADWPATEPWMPPPPPIDAFGANRLALNAELEFDLVTSAPALETYRTNLRNATGPNPSTPGSL